ncbi:MAG TPA: protein-L-isoaspartate(D-aspartate) O-methyltransferase [Acidocella sp.]|nr:protein-L-isoaspartate(D-aspartate) O-methyltransferase [Acidocella sp.]
MADSDALAIARDNMVDSQIRPNHVHDLRVTGAMRVLPREAFAAAGPLAYSDADLPLGGGRFMLSPMVVARLAQLALETNPAHVLVIGAGSGYLAALLSLAGAGVVALEEETRLTGGALAAYAPKAQAVTGRLNAGWPAAGPYDAIIIEGAVLEIPAVLAAQLSPGGRIVTILADDSSRGALGRAVVAEPVAGGYATVKVFDCAARLLPQFTPAPAFSF